MPTLELALDIGSSVTRAAANKISYLVKEPSVAAVDASDAKSVRASGAAAIKMFNNPLMARVKIAQPFFEGTVVDKDSARALFKCVIEKAMPKGVGFSKVAVTCLTSPCATKSDKQTIEQALTSMDVRQTTFVNSPLADAMQIFSEFSIKSGIICNIGATKCEIAAIDGVKIVAACTLSVGGRTIDKEITALVREKYGMVISPDEAQRIKHVCGSLYTNDNSAAMCYGTSAQNGLEEEVGIYARELYNCIAAQASVICGTIASMLSTLMPAQKEEGIILCGGSALLTGIDKYLHDALKINVRTAKDPEDVTINGGKLLVSEEN